MSQTDAWVEEPAEDAEVTWVAGGSVGWLRAALVLPGVRWRYVAVVHPGRRDAGEEDALSYRAWIARQARQIRDLVKRRKQLYQALVLSA
ncbi:MAG: hypothetical protein GY953_46895 [bacterium]|nr:hypothetical protein [bacterium]